MYNITRKIFEKKTVTNKIKTEKTNNIKKKKLLNLQKFRFCFVNQKIK